MAYSKIHLYQVNTQQSPLLKLAPEIRNSIYLLAVKKEIDVEIPDAADISLPPLLHVCKPIRKEAGQLYYLENSFKKTIRDGQLGSSVPWLGAIGTESCKNIKRLVLHYRPAVSDQVDPGCLRAMLNEQLERRAEMATLGASIEERETLDNEWKARLVLQMAKVVELLLLLRQKGVAVANVDMVAEDCVCGGKYDEKQQWEVDEVLGDFALAKKYFPVDEYTPEKVERSLKEFSAHREDGAMLDMFGAVITALKKRNEIA